MFDSIGNKLGNVYKSAYTSVMPVQKDSAFLTKGTLIPGEFIQAGDQLTKACPSWQWKGALEVGLINKVFPEDKQYLITTVQSAQRVSDMFKTIGNNESHLDDEWVITQKTPHNLIDNLIEEEKEEEEEEEKKEEKKEEDEMVKDFVRMEVDEEEANVKTRVYTISIVYDFYYSTPRVYISGVDLENQVLTQDDIFQDIMSEYANKTVTFETMPYLNQKMASIHPCKHSEALSKIIAVMTANGMNIQPHMVLFIFLKFINSIMPTLDFDSTLDVYIA